MAEFPELMANARKNTDISLRDLSTTVGISAGQLSNYERGASVPKRDAVIAIAEALKIPVNLALMSSGFTPIYYNAADEEAARIAEEHAAYFARNSVGDQIVSLVTKVLDTTTMMNLRASVSQSLAFGAHLSTEQISAMTKIDIAINLLMDAEKGLNNSQKNVQR